MNDDELNRVIVRVGAGHPELRDDLRALPPQARAERLRALASAALLMRGGGGSDAAVPDPPAPEPANNADPEEEERMRRFARLRGRLGDAE